MKAVECGGTKKQFCCVYGNRGSKHPPSDRLLNEAKRATKSKKDGEQNKAKRDAAKGCS